VDDSRVKNGGSATQINLCKPVQLQTCPKSSTKGISLELEFTKTKETFHIEITLSNSQNTVDNVVKPFSRSTRPGIFVRSKFTKYGGQRGKTFFTFDKAWHF
jgi:hypothetical protein